MAAAQSIRQQGWRRSMTESLVFSSDTPYGLRTTEYGVDTCLTPHSMRSIIGTYTYLLRNTHTPMEVCRTFTSGSISEQLGLQPIASALQVEMSYRIQSQAPLWTVRTLMPAVVWTNHSLLPPIHAAPKQLALLAYPYICSGSERPRSLLAPYSVPTPY